MKGYEEGDDHIGPSLSRFVRRILALATEPFYPSISKGTGIRHFLADPTDGSGCKRLNLFLRWMVRKDGIDLGLWKEVSAAKLIIPLDTHLIRLGTRLGLTTRKSPDWKMAVEITEALRGCDPDDPVKYDFALCTVGKLHACPARPDENRCRDCPVMPCCGAHS